MRLQRPVFLEKRFEFSSREIQTIWNREEKSFFAPAVVGTGHESETSYWNALEKFKKYGHSKKNLNAQYSSKLDILLSKKG